MAKLQVSLLLIAAICLIAASCCYGEDQDWDVWAYQKINHFLEEKLPSLPMRNDEFVGEELDLNLNVVRGFLKDEEAKESPDGKLMLAASSIVALADMKGREICEPRSLDLMKDISSSIGAAEDATSVDRIQRIVSLFLKSYADTCAPAQVKMGLKAKFDLKMQEKLRKFKMSS